MLYVCSFTFGFCNWHRHIIIANLINIIIATIDKVFHIPVTDIELLIGIIPPGHKEVGFKELSWSSKILMKQQ